MTRVHMDLDMEVADLAEFRGYLRNLADWLEERGMMDADLMHYGRRVGRIGTEEDGDVPLRYVRGEVQGGRAPRVRVRELGPDVPALLDQGQGPEAPDDRAGGGRPMRYYIATVPDGLGWDEVVSLAYDAGAVITWSHIDAQDVLRVWLEVSDDRADDLVDGCGRLSITLEEKP